MPVSIDTDRITIFEPVEPTTDFAIDWPVFDAAAFYITVDGVVPPLNSWSFLGTFDTSAVPNTCVDGVIHFGAGVTGRVVIAADSVPKRPNDFQFQDGVGVPPRSFNAALNLLTALAREQDQKTRAAIRFPPDVETPLLDPAQVEGRFLFGAIGGGVRGAEGEDILPLIAQAAVDAVTTVASQLIAVTEAALTTAINGKYTANERLFNTITGTKARPTRDRMLDRAMSILEFEGIYPDQPLMDSSAGLQAAANCGRDVEFPMNLGTIYYSTPPVITADNVTWFSDTPQRTPGAGAEPRTTCLKLTSTGTFVGSVFTYVPFIHAAAEGFICKGLLFEGENASSRQIGILFKKPYAPGYNKGAACDGVVKECRFTNVEIAIQTWGWGVEIDNCSTGIVRIAHDLQFPDDGTFSESSSGQSYDLGFRQIRANFVHAHATTWLLVNAGPNAARLNGLIAVNLMSDTGGASVRGTFVNAIFVAAVSTNAEDVNLNVVDDGYPPKRAALHFLDGTKRTRIVGVYSGGYVSGGESLQPSYSIRLTGAVEISIQSGILGYCLKSAIFMEGAGLKRVHLAGVEVHKPCSDNEATVGTPHNVFDLSEGTAEFYLDGTLYVDVDNHTNKGAAAIFGVSNGVPGSAFKVFASMDPVFANYALVQSGVEFNQKAKRLFGPNLLAPQTTAQAGHGFDAAGSYCGSRAAGPAMKLQRYSSVGAVLEGYYSTTLRGTLHLSSLGMTFTGWPGPYADNAAAVAAGMAIGQTYRRTSDNALVVVV